MRQVYCRPLRHLLVCVSVPTPRHVVDCAHTTRSRQPPSRRRAPAFSVGFLLGHGNPASVEYHSSLRRPRFDPAFRLASSPDEEAKHPKRPDVWNGGRILPRLATSYRACRPPAHRDALHGLQPDPGTHIVRVQSVPWPAFFGRHFPFHLSGRRWRHGFGEMRPSDGAIIGRLPWIGPA